MISVVQVVGKDNVPVLASGDLAGDPPAAGGMDGSCGLVLVS